MSDVETYNKATVIKTVWLGHNDRQINGTKQSPVITPQFYDQKACDKGAKDNSTKETVFSTNVTRTWFSI